eukprot:1604842-Rhodomonas_salina.3
MAFNCGGLDGSSNGPRSCQMRGGSRPWRAVARTRAPARSSTARGVQVNRSIIFKLRPRSSKPV